MKVSEAKEHVCNLQKYREEICKLQNYFMGLKALDEKAAVELRKKIEIDAGLQGNLRYTLSTVANILDKEIDRCNSLIDNTEVLGI